MADGRNPYGVSFIQTSAGAMITGEIKRYASYEELMNETAPTRLASVSNASRDTDYPVPAEHQGGILFQRDFINSTWILLYKDTDLAIPSFVEWEHILNVPPWVGGVSNNRVKLIQNTSAVPRTTYYSYGNFRLVLPPADHPSVKLGDEVVLEQYDNCGAVLYEAIEGEQSLIGEELVQVGDKKYHVFFTTPYYDFEPDPNNSNAVYGQPITCCAYKFICTETMGDAADLASEEAHATRVWRPYVVKDNISSLITDLRALHRKHSEHENPHTQYILKSEAKNYLSVNVAEATADRAGIVRLAVSSDFGNMTTGAVAVSPYQMVKYIQDKYVSVITDANKDRRNLIVTPYVLKNYSLKDHTHSISDVTNLQEELDNRSLVGHTHDIPEITDLEETLLGKSNVGHTHTADEIFNLSTIDVIYDKVMKPDVQIAGYNKTGWVNPGYFLVPLKDDKDKYFVAEWGIIRTTTDEHLVEIGFTLTYDYVFHVDLTTVNDRDNWKTAFDSFPQFSNYLYKTSTGYADWNPAETNKIRGMNIYWQWSSDGDYQPPDHTTVMWMITGIATFDDSVEERTKLLAIMFGRDRPAGDLTTPNWLLINTTRKTYLRRLTGVFLDSLSWIQLYNGPANVMKSDGSFWERESDDWGIYGANGAMQLVDDISIDTQQGNTSTVYQQTFGIRRARYDAESQQANYYVSPGWMAFGYVSTALDKYANTQTYVSSNKRDNYIFFPMNYVDVEAYDLVVIINGESNVLRFCGTVSDKKWSNSDYLLKQNVSTWSIRTNGLTEATGVELYRSVSTTANSPAETSYNPVTSIGVDTTTIANVIVKEIPVELYIKLTANKSLYIKHDVWKNAVDPYRVIHSNASGVLTKLYVDTITKYLTGKTDGVVKKVGFWNNNPTHVTGNDIRIDNMVFNSDSTASMSNITGTESKKACDIETTIYGLVDRSNATYIANSIIGEYQNNYSFIITINKINYECTRFEERDIDDAGLFIPGLTGVLLCWKYSIGNNDTEYVYSTAKYPHKGDVVYKETLSKYQVYSVNSNNVAVLYSISTIRAVDTSTATAKIQINVLGDIDTNASSSSNVVLKWYSRATQYDRGSRVFDENTGTWVNINGSGKAWLNEETHTVVYTTEEVPSVGTQVYRVFINNRESSHNKYTTNPPTIVYAGSDIKRNGKDTRYDKPDITASHSEYAAGIKDDWTRPKPFVGRYIVIPLDSTGSTQLIIVTGIFIHDYEGEVYLKIPSNLTGPYGNNVVACSFTAMTDEDTDVCRQMSAFFHGLSTGTCQVTAGIMERYDKHANGHYTKFNWMIAYINKPATV